MSTQHYTQIPTTFDVIIAGGGPASVLCACELQGLGYQVGIIDAGETLERVEGLSPRAVQLLERKALTQALSAVSPYVARKVYWGTLTSNSETSTNGEYLVYRPAFDNLLREAAQARGITLIKQKVTTLHSLNQVVQVQLENDKTLEAQFIVDARGRRANHMAHQLRAPKNLAIAAWLDTPTSAGYSAIHALEQGWLWLAQTPHQTQTWVQLVLDARDLPIGQTPTQVLLTNLQTVFKHPIQLTSDVVVRGADFRLNTDWHLTKRIVPVGDAACAFDPLSGHGLFWAFSSALSAAAVVNTLLQDSSTERFSLCEQFYRQRQTETFWRQARVGRDFYQAVVQEHNFWQHRSSWPDQQPLKTQSTSTPSIFIGPAIRNNQVEAMRLLQVPDEASPVAWFGELRLVDTLEACWSWQAQTQQSIDFAAFTRLCAPPTAHQTTIKQCWLWLQKYTLLNRPIST